MLGRLSWRWGTPTYAYDIDRKTVKRREDEQWRREFHDEELYPELEETDG